MIESLVIALREGIEIALVLGILVTYVRKIGRISLLLPIYLSLAFAVIGSVAGAVVLQRMGIDQESLEGYFMLVAAVFVASMIVWMWRTAKTIRAEIEQKVSGIVQTSASWKAHAGLFLFTFFMIVREGIETVIFLQAVALSTSGWSSLAGTVTGIGLATVFAILFIRGSTKINIGRFLKITAFTLLIFTVQLVMNAVHEFYENGVFPANPKMMGILGPIVQHDLFFILAIISIPAFMLIIPGRKRQQQAATISGRRWQLSFGVALLAIMFFLGGGEIFSSSADMDFTAVKLGAPQDGFYHIPIGQVSDGKLHRFAINDRGLEIRFFVLRTSLGKFATAFDACYACYSYGHYYLKNDELVCSQCDAVSPLSKLTPATDVEPDENNSGSMEGNGCAPIYLPSVAKNGVITIKLADLERRRKYFDISQ